MRVGSLVVCFLIWNIFVSNVLVAEDIRFDCPANVAANTLDYRAEQKLVEIQIPVSAKVLNSNWNPKELSVEVVWSGETYAIVDYSPKSVLTSNFDGPIDVETKRQTNFKIVASVGSTYLDFISPSLDATANRSDSKTLRYKEIPDQRQVVSSGTLNRGTGVFFQFRPSRTEKLVGGRTLSAIFEVPLAWRGGIMELTFKMNSTVKKFPGLKSEVEFARRYVMPIYLAGDEPARNLVEEYSRTEQKLRSDWYRVENSVSSNSNSNSLIRFQKTIPNDFWMHQLIQSGNKAVIEKYRRQIPQSIQHVAMDLVNVRHQIAALSR